MVLSAPDGECPLELTSRVVDYLAGQSAGRCGPCFNGLPALARALGAVRDGHGGLAAAGRPSSSKLVERRGACAHPDGTVRLVRSLLCTFAGEVAAHAEGRVPGGGSAARRTRRRPLLSIAAEAAS